MLSALGFLAHTGGISQQRGNLALVERRMYLSRQSILVLFITWSVAGLCGDAFKEGGEAYKQGDYATAAAKFKEVAEVGDHRAMYALGSMYASGNGVPKDYQQAFAWLSKAAGYGRTDAQYKLGLMYDIGIGAKKNPRRAIRLYDTAAKKGYAHAQFRLGLMYVQGSGVKQDNIKAYAWFKTAEINYSAESTAEPTEAAATPAEGLASADDPFARIHAGMIQTALRDLTAVMTPDEVRAAQTLAQEYLRYR